MTDRSVRAVAAVVAVLAAVVLIGAVARSGRPTTITAVTKVTPVAPATATSGPQAPPPPPQEKQGRTDWSFAGVLLAVVAVLAMMFMYALALARNAKWFPRRFNLGDRSGKPDPDLPAAGIRAELASAADAALRQLEDGEPTEAVIACWVLLERAAADAGVARRPAETAAELTARVLAAYQVDPATLGELADRYREARYSSHPIGEPARDQARTLLTRVRAQLTPAAAAP